MLFERLSSAVKSPTPATFEERLKAFPIKGLPLKKEVEIYWNKEAVPFIAAQHDLDLACAMGLVHAHLRLGQMEIMRRVAQGRISEMVGPLTRDLDKTIRMLDLGRAAEPSIRSMSHSTREFLEYYVSGINHYLLRVETLPHEYSMLGLSREAWNLRDVFLLSRLAGADINWLVYGQLLPVLGEPAFAAFWARLMAIREAGFFSFEHGNDLSILTSFSRGGSNSFVVSGPKRGSAGALIASDPHVGFDIPNNWLLLGLHSPGFNAVGITLPGLPMVVLGRNLKIAWGATNMRALSSCLYKLEPADLAKARVRIEKIRTRFLPARDFKVRETELGPVFTDAPLYGQRYNAHPLAMRWVGHEQSDELGALLKVNQAGNWEEFRAAFKDYAVSGQNYLYADCDGNIGQLMAVRLPEYDAAFEATPLLSKETVWRGYKNCLELPCSYNPANGYLVTANNSPVAEKLAGMGSVRTALFYSADDRAARLAELVRSRPHFSVADAMSTQLDVTVPSALALLRRIKDLCPEGFAEKLDAGSRELFRVLLKFDGNYSTDSNGALAFQLFSCYFARSFLAERYGDRIAGDLLKSDVLNDFLATELEEALPGQVEEFVLDALRRSCQPYKRHGTWGAFHKLKLEHALARIPLIGSRYRFGTYGVPGTSNSVWKTWNDVTDQPHFAHYGTSARHISDLNDPDANYFILLGGQDGWINSVNFLDQVPCWLKGEYIRVPLLLATVKKEFKTKLVLKPGAF